MSGLRGSLLITCLSKIYVIIVGQVKVKPGEILPGLRRTHEKNPSRTAQAETEGEMSRFRKYRTPVNQGFPATAQWVCDTFILYPRKSRFKCVTEATDRR